MQLHSIKLTILSALALLLVAFNAATCSAQTNVQAVAGEPFGVGKITVSVPAGGPLEPISDDRFVLREARGRVLYPAMEAAPVRRVLRELLDIPAPRRVAVYFLFLGSDPLDLTFHAPQPQRVSAPVRNDPREHRQLLEAWWREYGGAMRRLGRSADYPPIVENYLTATLARRLGLEMPTIRAGWLDRNQANEAFGLVAGSESARLAIQRDLLLGSRGDVAEQDLLPLREEVTPDSFESDAPRRDVAVEPIAMHVPQECFYVRFGSFSNYLWLREFLERRGGDLRNMIIRRGLDYEVNERLERQLALRESALAKVLGPAVIADIAIIGHDTLLRDGAAIGILFQARNSLVLSTDIRRQRSEALAREPDATEQTVDIAGHPVSFLSTPDGRVRSYYAADGEFHLVSTCRHLVRRFFEAGAGAGSLGQSAEFLSARNVMPLARDDTVFIFFSKAFFRTLLSPQYHAEMGRRLRAASDMQHLQLARLAAQAEGSQSRDVDELIKAGMLPDHFGRRPDESKLVDGGQEVMDSLRGAVGSFLPVADVPVDGITEAERRAYEEFARSYRSDVHGMGPVVAVVERASHEVNGQTAERITLEARLPPDLLERWPVVAALFGEPDRQCLAPVEGDAVAVQVVTSGRPILEAQPRRSATHLFGAIRDIHLPLAVRHGELELDGFPRNIVRGYVGAWPKPGLLEGFVRSANRSFDAEGYARLPEYDAWQRKLDEFLILSFKRDVLREVAPQLKIIERDRPAQIRLHAADLAETGLGAAANSFGYMRARLASVSGSRLANTFAEQLNVPPEECKNVAEEMLGARLVCALGGEYKLVEHAGGLRTWSSTALQTENRFLLTRIPEDYRLPLLDWFGGLEAELAVTDDAISAHVELHVHPQAFNRDPEEAAADSLKPSK